MEKQLFDDLQRILYWHSLLIETVTFSGRVLQNDDTGVLHLTVDEGHYANVTFTPGFLHLAIWNDAGEEPRQTGSDRYPMKDWTGRAHELANIITRAIGQEFGPCSKGWARTDRKPGSTIEWDRRVHTKKPKADARYVIDGLIVEASKESA